MLEKKLITEERSSLAVPGAVGLLTENSSTMKIVQEVKENSNKLLRIKLPVAVLDKENLNKRLYPTELMRESVSRVKTDMSQGKLLCTGDGHPPTPRPEPIHASHKCIDAFIESVNGTNFLMNVWEILKTDSGKNLQAVIEGGGAFGVSIRGMGRTDNEDGESGKMLEYDYLGTDAVGEPSARIFTGTKVPNLEILESVEVDTVNESIEETITKDDITKFVNSMKGLSADDKKKITSKISTMKMPDKLDAPGMAKMVGKVIDDLGLNKESEGLDEAAIGAVDKSPKFTVAVVGIDVSGGEADSLSKMLKQSRVVVDWKFTTKDRKNAILTVVAKSDKDARSVVDKILSKIKSESVIFEVKEQSGSNLVSTSVVEGHSHKYDPSQSGDTTENNGHTHTYNSEDKETGPGGVGDHTHELLHHKDESLEVKEDVKVSPVTASFQVTFSVEDEKEKSKLCETFLEYKIANTQVDETTFIAYLNNFDSAKGAGNFIIEALRKNNINFNIVKMSSPDGIAESWMLVESANMEFFTQDAWQKAVQKRYPNAEILWSEAEQAWFAKIGHMAVGRFEPDKEFGEINESFPFEENYFIESDGREELGSTVYGFHGEGRKRILTQYIKKDNLLTPARDIDLLESIPPGIYQIINTMEGIKYEMKELKSDEIIRFEDSRYNTITEEINDFWELKNNFENLGLTHKRGVLVHGAPGCGKSCILKQAMEDTVKDGHVVFIGKHMGTTVEGVKQFKEVEQDRNCLVVFEDVDEILGYNEHAFLEFMDGDDQMSGVLVLSTTNYLERLPARIMRSGRFDTKMEIGNPPKEGRIAYFKHKLPQISEEELQELVDATDDFSFAQMREMIVSVFGYERSIEDSANRIRRNFTEGKYDGDSKRRKRKEVTTVNSIGSSSIDTDDDDEEDKKKSSNESLDESVKEEIFSMKTEASIRGAQVSITSKEEAPGGKIRVIVTPDKPEDYQAIEAEILSHGYVSLESEPGTIEFLVQNQDMVNALPFVKSEAVIGAVGRDSKFDVAIVGIDVDKGEDGQLSKLLKQSKAVADWKFTTSDRKNARLVVVAKSDKDARKIVDKILSKIKSESVQVEVKGDLNSGDESSESLESQVSTLMKEGKQAEAMRLILNEEAEINESKLTTKELEERVATLDKIKVSAFGEGTKSHSRVDVNNDTEKLNDNNNDISRNISEVEEALAKLKEQNRIPSDAKAIIGKTIPYIEALKSVLGSSISTLEEYEALREKLLDATDLEVDSFEGLVTEILKNNEDSEDRITKLTDQLEDTQDIVNVQMNLVEDVRASLRKDVKTLKERLSSAYLLIDELRSRIKLSKRIQHSVYQAPSDIAETVQMIINRNPQLVAYEKELLQSETVSEVHSRAHKYNHTLATENSRQNLRTLTTDDGEDMSYCERNMPPGYK